LIRLHIYFHGTWENKQATETSNSSYYYYLICRI